MKVGLAAVVTTGAALLSVASLTALAYDLDAAGLSREEW